MRKSLLVVFLLGIAVLLVGCHHEGGYGTSEITETIQDDRAGDVFELGFDTRTLDKSQLASIKSENFDMYRTIALQNCKGLKCGGNLPFERNEDLPVELADYFSGQRYNLSLYTLLKKYDNNDLLLDQNNAEFEFLTDTEFVSKGDQIVIPDVKKQLPIAIAFKKTHYIGGNYERINTIVVRDKYTLSPRFYEIEIKSPVTQEIQNYKFNTTYNAIINNAGEKDKLVKNNYTIQEKIGTDFSILLKGLDKKPKVSTTITMSENNIDYNSQRKGNDIEISFKGLERGKAYHFDLDFVEAENNYNYTYRISFRTIEDYDILVEKQMQNEKKLTNQYALCFTQEVKKESLATLLDKNVGSGNYSFYKQNLRYEFDRDMQANFDNCYKINFYTDPNKTLEINLENLESIYGEFIDYKFSLAPFSMSDSDSYFKLIGNPITFLARKGEYGHKIQIVNKNKTEGELYYRACGFVGEYTDDILKNFAKAKESDYYSNRFLAQNFVNCGPTQIYNVKNIQKEYRKEYVQEIEFGDLFSGGIPSIIEVGVEPFEKTNGYLYVRTNIGLIAKYTPNELHVWAHYFDNGKALAGASYILSYYDENQKKFITVKGGIKDYFNYSFPKDINLGFLYVYDEYDASFILFPKDGFGVPQEINKDYIYFSNPFSINAYDIGGSPAWSKLNEYKLYTYTDRVLYKAGEDEIFVSGWIRKQGDSKKPRGTLTIELYGPQGNIVDTQDISNFDEFGGFKAKFALDKDSKLGSYRISSNFNQNGENIYYDNYIQVQEYKKPNIALNTELYDDDDSLFLRITPQYYFGQYLKKYDVQLSYSLKKQNYGIYDWSRCGATRCDEPYYYNVMQNYQGSSGGKLSIEDYEGKYFDLDLSVDSSSLSNFNIDISLVDDETNEVVHSSITEKILPKYLVGLKGRTRNWHNTNDGDFLLEGELLKKISNNKDQLKNYKASANENIKILIYHKSFDNEQELGPDGEYYYTNRGEYTLEKTISSKTKNGKFSKNISFDTPGNCFIRVIYEGKHANYENQQYIYISDWDYSNYYDSFGVMGYMGNNYELEIFVKDKEYDVGENIDVNIDPYIKGATAIVTVEKNGKILEQKNLILDGKTIKLKAQKDRYPNAHVSVVQIVGEELNKTISKRSEPRFYIGYENMKLSPQMMDVDFDVSLSNLSGEKQNYYYPGQKISLDIKTTDYNNKGIKSRVSVGIVDKALLDIYDQLRKPLEDFYIFSNPGFFIISNYHLLFKALEVFNADGSKGGGGGEGGSSISTPRKNFLDIAFWRGGEITDNNGNLHFETTLPDNLTTRVIDLIAVGTHGEMGTYREYFTVSKDIILNVFLPRFIASYSTVRVPVSVITNKTGINIDLQGTIKIGDDIGGAKQDIVFIEDNDNYYFDLNIDSFELSDILDNEYIEISISAGSYDAVVYKLPIRKENMTINLYKQYDTAEVSDSIKLDSNSKYSQIDLVVSTVPIAEVSESIRYLLHYPYGCTEQLLSSLYPTLIAKDLADKGFLEEGIISGGLVNYQGNRNNIDHVINSTLNKIYKNQTSDGLFSYRQGGTYPNKSLSIYVFHILSYIQDLGYTVDQDVYKRLGSALKDFDTVSEQLYSMMQLALVEKNTSTQQAAEILKRDPNLNNKIMTYVIYAYNGFDDSSLYQEIKSELNKQEKTYNYHAYYDISILKSYLTRALIKNGKSDEAFLYVKGFIQNTNSRGMRGRSTQRNMQIIRAIADYMFEEVSQDNDISGEVSINGDTYPFKLGFLSTETDENDKNISHFLNHQKFSVNLEDISQVDISVKSNKELLTSLKIEYIPQNIRDIEAKASNVKSLNMGKFELEDLNLAKVGDIIPVVANFSVEKDVNQLAVVYNIPAFSYLINTIGKGGYNYSCRDCYYQSSNNSNSENEISFTSKTKTNKRYNCTPDHYEIRYDRLFLYYEDLPANAECDISFSLIKTHAGNIKILGQELFEMYSPDVWAKEYLY